MRFSNLRNAVVKENETKRTEWLDAVNGSGIVNNMSYVDILTRWATQRMCKAFYANKAGEKELKKSAVIQINRQYDKMTKKSIEKIAIAENAGSLHSIHIGVDWHNSRTWGMNPCALVKVYTESEASRQCEGVYTGSASGCGYDKLSTAIADALNRSPSVMRVIYAVANSLDGKEKEYRGKIGYGSGYAILPYFEGGVGVSCYRSIFEKIGYIWRDIANGKTYDVFTVEKNARR